MPTIRRAAIAAAILAGLAVPILGQSSVSPFTISQRIFSAQTTAQVTPNSSSIGCVPTNGTPCGVPNGGLNVHTVTYIVASPCVGAFGLDLRLEASNDGVNFFTISEDAVDQPSNALQGSQLQGAITAIGYYPVVRANLVKFNCGNGTPNLTAIYSGTWTVVPTAAGIFGQALPYRKVLVINADTTAAQPSITVTVPTGNSAGTVYVQCTVPATGAPVACPANGGFQPIASIADSGNVLTSLASFTVAASSNLQQFTIPATLTNRVSFTFTPTGGGGGTNWSIYYQINPNPGSPATGTNAPQVQTTGADPCASSSVLKSSTFANITTATTTSLVGVSGTKAVFVCEIDLQLNSTTASTILFEYGTAGACTGPVVLTATYTNSTIVSEPLKIGSGSTAILSTPGGNGLCAVTTVGTSPTIPVTVSYVQQ